jgi:hypothetical protein
MPPERSKVLVDQLHAWYKAGTTRQMDLAAALELRPQQLAEILAGRNGLTGEQALAINSFLESQSMATATSQRRLNPSHQRPTSQADDEPLDPMTDEPLTLYEASEVIDALRAKLKSKPADTRRVRTDGGNRSQRCIGIRWHRARQSRARDNSIRIGRSRKTASHSRRVQSRRAILIDGRGRPPGKKGIY